MAEGEHGFLCHPGGNEPERSGVERGRMTDRIPWLPGNHVDRNYDYRNSDGILRFVPTSTSGLRSG